MVEHLPLGRLLTLALRLLVDEMHQRLQAAGYGDLRPAHGYVLNAAAAEGGVTASALAGMLGMTKQGAAKVITELVEAGYIVRGADDADARARPATLTSRGHAALGAAAEIQRQLEAEWAALVTARDMTGLRRTLERALHATSGDADLPPLRPVW
ncbi:MAG: hypothetical protein AVDCRST_MAG76-3695 [uncultured Acidimicrobiales bacterium]|uniref:HTH marR-type domain-containing protein n=1 Tax=uncultured Acidimicrobiales bacterium TaxID=310071 RepID=A0A6J4JGQ6_9ACTN|nr:MAG: hypothetical protein AVDCRST_MAG76-3695 [uncultured Acidimicrobiales bacterium]